MVLITCKKCGDINDLTSKALGNLTDFGFKYRYCNTINRVTLERETYKIRIVRKPIEMRKRGSVRLVFVIVVIFPDVTTKV
jgi:hypothetical protein